MKYKEIKKDRELREYIARGNEKLGVMGYTDHSEKHCILVAERAGMILKKFEYPEHTIELAKIAGFMHDIGNCVNRSHHAEYCRDRVSFKDQSSQETDFPEPAD